MPVGRGARSIVPGTLERAPRPPSIDARRGTVAPDDHIGRSARAGPLVWIEAIRGPARRVAAMDRVGIGLRTLVGEAEPLHGGDTTQTLLRRQIRPCGGPPTADPNAPAAPVRRTTSRAWGPPRRARWCGGSPATRCIAQVRLARFGVVVAGRDAGCCAIAVAAASRNRTDKPTTSSSWHSLLLISARFEVIQLRMGNSCIPDRSP